MQISVKLTTNYSMWDSIILNFRHTDK